MTTLGTMVGKGNFFVAPLCVPGQLDLNAVAVSIASSMVAAGFSPGPSSILASLVAWTMQDDDAHEPCSLTACRHPLHPGPCKGWKGTLHQVSPGTYKQIEEERVRKANERRVKRIADLKAQGKPIPRRLLTEIKPKPAPTTHAAQNASTVPLGQVNQKADLAGGQAHAAGQAVSKAAGVQVKTAPPLPLGPKQKKPTVAGRGPAFVITQPKVTDTYKLDKADKITPQQWDDLSDADKTAIRNELTAIKARGFGPQQTKADALLAKLPAATPGSKPSTANPGAVNQPNPTPGKVTLGQAVKTPQLPAPAPSSGRGTRDQNGILVKAAPGGAVTSTSVGLPNGYRITRDGMGYSLKHNGKLIRTSADQASLEKYAKDHAAGNTAGHVPSIADQLKGNSSTPVPPSKTLGTPPTAPPARTGPDIVDQVKKAQDPANKLPAPARTFVYRKLTKAQFDGLDDATKKQIVADLDEQISNGAGPTTRKNAADLKDKFGVSGASSKPSQAAPASSPATSGPTPSAPLPPGTPPAVQHANAVANRSAPKAQMAKTHLDAYGKLSKADFDSLSPAAQKTIRDDLANAKGKFLDPKKQKDAADLLDRFGAKHSTTTPAAPGNAKGYSDPQQEAVKATSSGLISTDDVLKTVGRLSPDSVKGLDDADRKRLLGRLAFVATHPKATPEQKAKAAAYGRIINGGSRVPAGQKWDHAPSIGELHREEEKGGHAATFDALVAAQDKTMDRADRIKALSALTPAQFKALPDVEQRRITDALTDLHVIRGTNSSTGAGRDQAVADAIERYTGEQPGIFRLKQAEADFRAGKINADKLHTELLHARVQDPGSAHTPGSPGDKLAKEAKRVAEDNPSLPLWLRATMIENKYGTPAYNSVSMAENQYNWKPAPRLSAGDLSSLFRAPAADLAALHPIQAEAVKRLRLHVLKTGLAPGSPWSKATQGVAVDAFLGTSYSPEVQPHRLREFEALPDAVKFRVRETLRDRVAQQSDAHAKVGTYITLRDIDGQGRHEPKVHAALLAASDSFGNPGDLDTYGALTPSQFQNDLPRYAREAIDKRLNRLQIRAEGNGPIRTWASADDPLKVMPGALLAHLDGSQKSYGDRRLDNAAAIARHGDKIINPFDRTRAYRDVPIGRFRTMDSADQARISGDLDSIVSDGALTLTVRYNAQFTKDVGLGGGLNQGAAPLKLEQLVAVGSVDPTFGNQQPDSAVVAALTDLSKADFDSLAPVYRETIDDRIRQLPGAQQQALTAKFHPAAPAAAGPSGVAPTSVQANVPPHVQEALDTLYGVHASGKSHTMAHQLKVYGALRGSDFQQFNPQEQSQLLGDLSFIATTAKGPSADKAKKLIDRFTPPGTPAGQVGTPAIIPPANSVQGQVRYATPLKGLAKAKDSGKSGDGWITLPGGQRVWGAHGAAGLLLQHVDPQTGEKRYLMVQRGPAISDPGKWTFPGGASDSKETPHEGATRETIEELGLKDDVFKDALVHGDHTFTVPGSTWKYTTVAAQVPNMIKPDLSTAHARAETSDAKWLTLAEIQALDKSGKLHHPIAGGKLEQNVISLFPQTAGLTLGQIARPGPVTKRLGRLRMPAGGRQTPANFNAWPHAHKPSKGKDLIPDKAAFDAQRQKIKQDRKLYDGKTADGRLAAIGAQQGFDDTPTVLDKKEIDRLLATGDYIEVFRGVSGAGGSAGWRSRGNSGGKTAAQINEEMRSGPAYYGKGIFGNGYYLATQRQVATQYADGTNGSIARMLIPKSAITKKYDRVKAEAFKNPRQSKAKGASSYEESTFYDPGRYAAAKGIDGIEIEPHHMSPRGGARHVASPGKPAFNWLNRSVLIMQKEPG
jgi:8-oxo-dGTP pyrophosphatase MutT (NUDIX family)